ncbi:hypothetical protein FB45DRAFT_838282 [Roridomyces roridus]|uniref:Uncharacterized protein n=1 Tax=Roridomyces roridus TaxID=1738132 RepID=A0AAD7BIL2_9AGAR|nr:hypothetical protein FB45DRAFT_838282 [Roridomyces roridus]
MSGRITQLLRAHTAEFVDAIAKRAPSQVDQVCSEHVARLVAREGRAIQELLTHKPHVKVNDLLANFNLQGLSEQLKLVAPVFWGLLESVSDTIPKQESEETPASSKRKRDNNMVFTTACAMMSLLRSQKANNFQAVIGLFLFGSGAAKREIEVFSHAGISLSYKSVMKYIENLSIEGVKQFQAVWKECECSIVWDNLNIAFRVESQRLDNKNHFDNGTTATLIPIYNPITGESRTPRGTLPLNMKPPRTSTRRREGTFQRSQRSLLARWTRVGSNSTTGLNGIREQEGVSGARAQIG